MSGKGDNVKRHLSVSVCVLAVLLLAACSSTPEVSRIRSDRQIDLSGYWNDTDVRIVCNSLLRDCLSSVQVSQFIQQYSSQNGGRLPACMVGTFRNITSEHIDTSIISTIMETNIANSGKMIFVAGGDTRQELRDERQDQQINASEATASSLGYETGAALLLTGTVRSIVERAGNRTVRSYFVNAELTNIQTNERLWMGLNDEIKKDIRQPNIRL
jgi:PBP1b-binding outer membrane lipoprotein LpoB